MQVIFGSIVLNEAEYILANLQQHYAYCDHWIIVEGADRRYPRDRVDEHGFSTDGTADIIRWFPDPDEKIIFIRHGWADNKCELRNRYAAMAHDDAVVVIDADEFLTHRSMEVLLDRLKHAVTPASIQIPHIHLWKDRQTVITGGYYDVPHDRAYRWANGCSYLDNHNDPCLSDGRPLRTLPSYRRHLRLLEPMFNGWTHDEPFWLHFGFCKRAENIGDKNAYYLNRGEASTRPETTRCRAAWFSDEVPPGCELHRWHGPMPEVLV